MSEVNEETLRAREALAGHYKEVLGLLGEDVRVCLKRRNVWRKRCSF
jgi:hypothetical protein